MIRHFFLDKTNTIVEGSYYNLGLNPVLQVGYGNGLMRGLIHFDESEIKSLICDKTFSNLDKLKFSLRMTNCFSIDSLPYEKELVRGLGKSARRAASFDLMLFRLPCEFDGGRGFDFESDFWITENSSRNTEGSSWYFAKSGEVWDTDREFLEDQLNHFSWQYDKYIKVEGGLYNAKEFFHQLYQFKNGNHSYILSNPERTHTDWNRVKAWELRGGVLSNDILCGEYEKYLDGKDSIIVGTQHFDFGDENLNIDITDYVNECIETGINYGLCLAFIPTYEMAKTEHMQYVGFVTDHTNTFFHPFIEASYNEYISDDRESFTLGKTNRLYLYSYDNGEPVNLDEVPSCNINGNDYDVVQATKGTYYVEFKPSDLSPDAIYEDVWTNIKYDGEESDDVQMEFVVNKSSKKVLIGNSFAEKTDVVPSLYGINDDERLSQGETREVVVDFRQKYTTDKKELVNSAKYRLYIKDGSREYDVIDYQPVEKSYLNNFFVIYTQDLIPNEYYVDIKVRNGRDTKYFKKVLKFTVASNVTERYE